jgi:hypothetical protein
MVLPRLLPLFMCGNRPGGTAPLLKTSARYGFPESNNHQISPTASLRPSAAEQRARLSFSCAPDPHVLRGDVIGWLVPAAGKEQVEHDACIMYSIAGLTSISSSLVPRLYSRDGIIPDASSAATLLYFDSCLSLKRFVRGRRASLPTDSVECCSHPPSSTHGLCAKLLQCCTKFFETVQAHRATCLHWRGAPCGWPVYPRFPDSYALFPCGHMTNLC